MSALRLATDEQRKAYVEEHAMSPVPPQPPNLMELLTTLYNKMIQHDIENIPPNDNLTNIVTTISILLRCPSIPQNCPFHSQKMVVDILGTISKYTESTPHNIALVKLLFNIIKTGSSSPSVVTAFVDGISSAAATAATTTTTTTTNYDSNNATKKSGAIVLIEFLQRPLSATNARLICMLLERLVATVPNFLSTKFERDLLTKVAINIQKAVISTNFPHGRGRVQLSLQLWNLLFAYVTVESKKVKHQEDVVVDGMIPLIQHMIALPDSPDNEVFYSKCASINLLLNARQILSVMCNNGGSSGVSDKNNKNDGISIFRGVLMACERWLITFCIEKKNKNKMNSTLLPLILILLRGMEDQPKTVGTLITERLKGCEYLRECIKCTMNTFESTSRVSIAMGDLVFLICNNQTKLLIEYVGTGPAMGVMQRKGFLNSQQHQ
jgi:hypothetical protein